MSETNVRNMLGVLNANADKEDTIQSKGKVLGTLGLTSNRTGTSGHTPFSFEM